MPSKTVQIDSIAVTSGETLTVYVKNDLDGNGGVTQLEIRSRPLTDGRSVAEVFGYVEAKWWNEWKAMPKEGEDATET